MARSPASPESAQADTSRSWLKVVVFLLLYGAFQWGYQGLRDSNHDSWFIHTLTVAPAAALINFVFPLIGVEGVGYKLVWPEGSLTLRAGCDGFEVIGIFAAAVLASDVKWRRGLMTLLSGCIAIWMLNQVRIAVLFAAVRHDRSWFDAIHTVLGPLVLIGAVALIYMWMVHRPNARLTS